MMASLVELAEQYCCHRIATHKFVVLPKLIFNML